MDRTAFSCYAGRYKDTVYRVALAVTGDGAAADGVVRRVLMDLCARSRPFADEDQARFWFLRRALTLSGRVPYTGRERAELRCGTGEERALLRAVADLPERTRVVLCLRWSEGLSVSETAHLLGISESAVEDRTARAENVLWERLTEEAGHGLQRAL